MVYEINIYVMQALKKAFNPFQTYTVQITAASDIYILSSAVEIDSGVF